MNTSDIIVNIKSMKDIQSIKDNTKYINLSLDSVNSEVIEYFLLNGKDYSYSDSIDNRNGFIYASYDMFKEGESIINSIIKSMPDNLNDTEKIRYIYIYLGKILCADINLMNSKNEIISFNRISIANNVWGAIFNRKVSDITVSKIFMYLCFRLGFKCELISSSIKGNVANKVYINNSFLVVDLSSDLYNIQGGFSTKYFDKYNDNKDIDRKIKYIKDEYMDTYIDRVLSDIDYNGDNVFENILVSSCSVMDINNIGTYELNKIYKCIFDKYIPNYDVKINNLYIYNGIGDRNHFTLFNYNDMYYSYNYNRGTFINMDYSILYDNIKSNRIGIYDDEDFELKEKRAVL